MCCRGRTRRSPPALLGLIWGIVYLRRGSIVAPIVSHAGFNTAEIFRYAVFGTVNAAGAVGRLRRG